MIQKSNKRTNFEELDDEEELIVPSYEPIKKNARNSKKKAKVEEEDSDMEAPEEISFSNTAVLELKASHEGQEVKKKTRNVKKLSKSNEKVEAIKLDPSILSVIDNFNDAAKSTKISTDVVNSNKADSKIAFLPKSKKM